VRSLLLVGVLASALAQDEAVPPAEETPEEDILLESVTGQPPRVALDAVEESDPWEEERSDPAVVVQASVALDMDIAVVRRLYEGIDRLYLRDYTGARDVWAALERDDPRTPIFDIGQVLIYQSLMMENFDFRFSAQYAHHARQAEEKLRAALEVPGHDAFETFLLAGILGIEGIHVMRQGEFVAAFGKGIDAMRVAHHCQELAPDFVDPILADGIYNYWRTAVAQTTRLIPSFGDHRELGISQMQAAARGALWVGPAANLAIAYAYLEERQYDEALVYLERNRTLYPHNLINLLLMTRTQLFAQDYAGAQVNLDTVARIDPENHRQHYYQSTLHLRLRRLEEAMTSIDVFLAKPLEDDIRAIGLSRKADIYVRLREYDDAEAFYEAAIELNGLKTARQKLKQLKKRRKAGEPP